MAVFVGPYFCLYLGPCHSIMRDAAAATNNCPHNSRPYGKTNDTTMHGPSTIVLEVLNLLSKLFVKQIH